MDPELTGADDYLTRAITAMEEANADLDAAARVFIEDTQVRQQLGDRLGRARNAMARAAADVIAHLARAGREGAAARAYAFFKKVPFAVDDRAQLVVAVVPLPLEMERLDEALFSDRQFHTSFNNRVNGFNYRHRGMKADFLIVVPGSSSPRERDGHFEFVVWADGSGDSIQTARLYASGLFIFTRKLYCDQTPKWVHTGFITETTQLVLDFAGELYQDYGIDVRTVGVQAALVNAGDFELRGGDPLGAGTAVIGPRLLLPSQPIVLSLPLTKPGRARIERALMTSAAPD